MHTDAPKTLALAISREARVARIQDPHVADLTAFVHELRAEMGSDYAVPYFDPMDGGVQADCLFLLEAPGPKAVASGFVSRNNPDETAKNFFLLNREAGIDRDRTVVWNVVPWYIGSGKKIRPANRRDLGAAAPALVRLVALLPRLHSIVLVGGKAATARAAIEQLVPQAIVHRMPHPSPMYVNRAPGNRDVIRDCLRSVVRGLPGDKRLTVRA